MSEIAEDPFAQHRAIDPAELSPNLSEWIASIRGTPGVFVMGVMVRAGTQFVTNLLALHPDVHRHPRDIWELPILAEAGRMLQLTDEFFDRYRFNRDRLGPNDLIGLLGTAIASYLQAAVAPGKRILLTNPGAHYLDYFHAFFPNEQLLLLMRDGRDVVASADKTWPKWGFDRAAQTWADNARMMMRTRDRMLADGRQLFYCTYEEVVADPKAFSRRACEGLGLDPESYPYKKIETHVRVKGSSSFEGPASARWKAKETPKDFKPTGRWESWPKPRKDTFKRIAGQTLIDCGYAEGFDW